MMWALDKIATALIVTAFQGAGLWCIWLAIKHRVRMRVNLMSKGQK
jgi:hypothetical protein